MKSTQNPQSRVTFRVFGVIGALAFVFSGTMGYSATQCYDFSKPAEGTVYQVGQTIPTQHGTVHLRKVFAENGDPMRPNPQGATIHNNVPIPGQGQNPSLLNHGGMTVQVIPQNRVSSVTMKFAENTGATDNQLWNLGVNGKRRVWRGQLSALNGQYLGAAQAGGRVLVSVNAVPDSPTLPTWVRGTLTLTADPVNPNLPNRGIERFSVGRSSQLIIDDVCMTE